MKATTTIAILMGYKGKWVLGGGVPGNLGEPSGTLPGQAIRP